MLMTAEYKGNIGELRNNIKLACARAYNDYCNSKRSEKYIYINLMALPEHLINTVLNENTSLKHGLFGDNLLMDLKLAAGDSEMDPWPFFNSSRIEIYKSFCEDLLASFKEISAFLISCSLEMRYFADLNDYNRKFKRFLEFFAEVFPRQNGVIKKITEYAKSMLDLVLGTMDRLVIMLYLIKMSAAKSENRIKAVIIAHGYSTASSIANVANYLLKESIF